MNENLIKNLKDTVLDYADEQDYAEIFNIFSATFVESGCELEQTSYSFNIMNNKQAARAVAKFGFETVMKAAKEDWIIYAEKSKDGNWIFSNKSPSAALAENFESFISDVLCRPRKYPDWLVERIGSYIAIWLQFH